MSKFQSKDPLQDEHNKNNQSSPQTHGIQPRQMGRSMGRTMGRSMDRFSSQPGSNSSPELDKTYQEERVGLMGQGKAYENMKDPEPKTLENACPGDVVLLPDGTTARMLEEVEVIGTREDPLGIGINSETKSTIEGEIELKKIVVLKTVEESGKVADALAEVIETDRVVEGYATSQKGKTSKFPTEQRQLKFYRADGTEDIITITQAKYAGNFQPGDSNKGRARTGETKVTKGLKGYAAATGLAGDFLDLAAALKGLADGNIDAVLASAPFLGPVFAGINAQSDEVMRDFQAREFLILLFTGQISDLSDFLARNPEIGLEVIYLSNEDIQKINNGLKVFIGEVENPFEMGNGKIPTLVDTQINFIKIYATIH